MLHIWAKKLKNTAAMYCFIINDYDNNNNNGNVIPTHG